MRKNPGKYRKWYRVFCAVLLIVSLLLTGCHDQPQIPTTEPAGTQTVPVTTPAATTAPTETEPDDGYASLNSLRQGLVETPQKFAVAYLGLLEDGNTDSVAFIRENLPHLCADLPFLTAFGPEDIVGDGGELFCIVPAEGTGVRLNRILRDEYGWPNGLEEYLSRDTDAPFLLRCNANVSPDTELCITGADGENAVWQVMRNHLGFVNMPYDEEYQPLAMDFSAYKELAEREYCSLTESVWHVPTAQELQGTSWCWSDWMDSVSMYLEYELFFGENDLFVRWYNNELGDYQVCRDVPWTLDTSAEAAVLKLDFGGFAGERRYNILLHESGETVFIMANVFTDDPILQDDALWRYMSWSDLCQAPAPTEMVGSWQRLFSEVDGDRTESKPGDATVVIQGTSEDTLTVSYTEKDSPERGWQNQPALVDYREMYDGCGNSLWVADVQYQGNYKTTWTVTLLTDGNLLLQTFWVMDDIPMVSYEWFEKIG